MRSAPHHPQATLSAANQIHGEEQLEQDVSPQWACYCVLPSSSLQKDNVMDINYILLIKHLIQL